MEQEINNYIYCLEVYYNSDELRKLKGAEEVTVTCAAIPPCSRAQRVRLASLLSFCQVLHFSVFKSI